MRWGTLNQQFKAVGWKRLTNHEVDPQVSNGHEFQGVGTLRALFGDTERRDVAATYLLLEDDEDDAVVVNSTISWYDSRANQPHRAPEWRLYYPKAAGAIQGRMGAGDLMVVCLTPSDSVAVILARAGSASETKLQFLFGIESDTPGISVKHFSATDSIDFTSARILEELGLASTSLRPDDSAVAVGTVAAKLIEHHPDTLPPGAVVSSIVAQVTRDLDPLADPDGALATWVEVEEAAFRLWEDERIARQIRTGFLDVLGMPDVAAFRALAMTLRQSRVSRAGGALQNHVARILTTHGMVYEAQARTERGERPDFLFPGSAAYADAAYPAKRLQLLAVKFTVKERWRQVLNEGVRVSRKHLLTVDRTITESTLSAMRDAQLVLCIPQSYRNTYSPRARPMTISVRDLIDGPLAEHRRHS